MTEHEIIEAIVQLVRGETAEALSEATASLTHAMLYEAACQAFGGWDVALAATLRKTLGTQQKAKRPAISPENGVRQAHSDAMRPLICCTSSGHLLRVDAEQIARSAGVGRPQPLHSWPDTVGLPIWFSDLNHCDAIAVASEDGRMFGWSPRLVPGLGPDPPSRRLGEREGVDGWVNAMMRGDFHREGSFVHVTALGKIKVSLTAGFGSRIAADGQLAFLLDDGDRPVNTHLGGKNDTLLIVSSDGFAIQFPLREVRPMGLKATGVKGMKLKNTGRAVGSLIGSAHEQFALITAAGYGKRMATAEFRPQSRAGLGLVAAKLSPGDQVACAVPCRFNADLIVCLSDGSALRIPAGLLPAQGRQARGEPIVEVPDGLHVVSASPALPAEM